MAGRTPFPPIEGLDDDARQGTYFTVIHPSCQFAVAQDSMWWLNVAPVGHARSRVEIGGCFPEGLLALCARNAERLEATARELAAGGAEVLAVPADVADERSVDAFFDRVVERYRGVDILVNNAGAFDGGRVDEISLPAWNNVVGVCLTGTFLCTRRAFAIMKEQGGGRILNIGSISAQRPRADSAAINPVATVVFPLPDEGAAMTSRGTELTTRCPSAPSAWHPWGASPWTCRSRDRRTPPASPARSVP